MDAREEKIQEDLHAKIQEVVQELNEDDEGVVTGWVLCYEQQHIDGRSSSGHLYGPRELTTWRALGLLEWVRRFCIPESLKDDDE